MRMMLLIVDIFVKFIFLILLLIIWHTSRKRTNKIDCYVYKNKVKRFIELFKIAILDVALDIGNNM